MVSLVKSSIDAPLTPLTRQAVDAKLVAALESRFGKDAVKRAEKARMWPKGRGV